MKIKKQLLLVALISTTYFGFGQANKSNLKSQFLTEFSIKNQPPSKPKATIFPDGVVINQKKYFIQIKEPDLSKVIPMPQATIDTTIHYHIKIVGEVKQKK